MRTLVEIFAIITFLLVNLSKIDFLLENIVITDKRLQGTEKICQNPQKMRHYLNKGGDANLRFMRLDTMHSGGGDWDEFTPLLCSVLESDINNIKILIDLGAELDYVNYRSSASSLTALEQAILMGNIEITKLLIDAGASINFPEEKRYWRLEHLPIFIAAREGHREIIEILISHQVDLDVKDSTGKSIFDHAKDRDILDLLNKYYKSK